MPCRLSARRPPPDAAEGLLIHLKMCQSIYLLITPPLPFWSFHLYFGVGRVATASSQRFAKPYLHFPRGMSFIYQPPIACPDFPVACSRLDPSIDFLLYRIRVPDVARLIPGSRPPGLLMASRPSACFQDSPKGDIHYRAAHRPMRGVAPRPLICTGEFRQECCPDSLSPRYTPRLGPQRPRQLSSAFCFGRAVQSLPSRNESSMMPSFPPCL